MAEVLKIGLTMRVVQASGYNEPRDALSHDWFQWMDKMGWLPVPVSNVLENPGSYLDALGVSAVILTGGNDVVKRAGGDFCQERNATESRVLEWAMNKGFPVLGVCRGLHMINLHLGGEVEADIGSEHVARDHTLRFDGLEGVVLSEPLVTNSYHGQGVRPAQLANDLQSVAESEDGFVEAVKHNSAPVLAVQWHPERPNPAADFDRNLCRRLFEEGAFWHV